MSRRTGRGGSSSSRRGGASNSHFSPFIQQPEAPSGDTSSQSIRETPSFLRPTFLQPTDFSRPQPQSQPQPSPQSPRIEEPTIDQLLLNRVGQGLPRLDPRRKPNTKWFGYEQVSRRITKLMKADYDLPYYNWSCTDQVIRDRWWRAFVQIYDWDLEFTTLVRREFESCAAKRLKSMINEVKTRRQAKKPRPYWIPEETYVAMCAYWDTPDHIAKCKAASKCRRSDRCGLGMAAHVGGSKPFATHYEDMEKAELKPSFLDLMEKTHKSKTGLWVDQKAEEINEICQKSVSERLSRTENEGDENDNTDLSQKIKNDVYLKTVTPSKGRIFGLGTASKKLSFTGSSSGSQGGFQEVEDYNVREELRATQEKLDYQTSKWEKLLGLMKRSMPHVDWNEVDDPNFNPNPDLDSSPNPNPNPNL